MQSFRSRDEQVVKCSTPEEPMSASEQGPLGEQKAGPEMSEQQSWQAVRGDRPREG